MSIPSFCIIPVRGGSKGLPRKNLAEFGGVSLLEWTISQAKQIYQNEHIIVSTEDAEMAEVARAAGVTVIDRPAELAQDETTTNAVVDHLLGQIDPDGGKFQYFTILQVTSPLRAPEDIRKAKDMMDSGEYDSVLSMYHEADSHPAKIYRFEQGKVIPLVPEMESLRRQDLPKVYRRNGAIFSCTRAFYDRTGKLWGGEMGMVEMPKVRSVDIDAPEDLEQARTVFETL